MTTTILLFQAVVAISIFVSGYRYRTVAASLWILFTLFAVYTYLLAAIQFLTIGVAWHYAGVPFGSAYCKTLLAKAHRLRLDEFGSFELECWNCAGSRCKSAKITIGGSWPLLSVSPTSAQLLAQRAELAAEMDKEVRDLEAQRPGHRLARRMKGEVARLRELPDPEFDRRESEKYLWIAERAQALHRNYVKRFTALDLLPVTTVLAFPVLVVALYINSAGGYDEKDVRMLIVTGSIMLASYLLQFLIGIYWLSRRRFLMPHLFLPGGGLLSLGQAA